MGLQDDGVCLFVAHPSTDPFPTLAKDYTLLSKQTSFTDETIGPDTIAAGITKLAKAEIIIQQGYLNADAFDKEATVSDEAHMLMSMFLGFDTTQIPSNLALEMAEKV